MQYVTLAFWSRTCIFEKHFNFLEFVKYLGAKILAKYFVSQLVHLYEVINYHSNLENNSWLIKTTNSFSSEWISLIIVFKILKQFSRAFYWWFFSLHMRNLILVSTYLVYYVVSTYPYYREIHLSNHMWYLQLFNFIHITYITTKEIFTQRSICWIWLTLLHQ